MEQLQCTQIINEHPKYIENKLYNIKEACEILGISGPSLRRAIKNERIKCIHVSKCLRIPASELNKLILKANLWNVKEAAEKLNVSEAIIRTLIKNGEIKALRFTKLGQFRIPKSEIDKFTNS